MQSGVGLVHSGERGIKFGLGLIKVRSGQTLSAVKGLRALEVLPCLDMLSHCLTYWGFCLFNLIFQVLLTNPRKTISAANIIPRTYIPAPSFRTDDPSNVLSIALILEAQV